MKGAGASRPRLGEFFSRILGARRPRSLLLQIFATGSIHQQVNSEQQSTSGTRLANNQPAGKSRPSAGHPAVSCRRRCVQSSALAFSTDPTFRSSRCARRHRRRAIEIQPASAGRCQPPASAGGTARALTLNKPASAGLLDRGSSDTIASCVCIRRALAQLLSVVFFIKRDPF